MSEISVTLPDGSSRHVPAGTPVRDVAAGISPRLAAASLAAVVNGRQVDLSYPLETNADIRLVTERDPEALLRNARREALLLHGPQDEDSGIAQEEIDKLFS